MVAFQQLAQPFKRFLRFLRRRCLFVGRRNLRRCPACNLTSAGPHAAARAATSGAILPRRDRLTRMRSSGACTVSRSCGTRSASLLVREDRNARSRCRAAMSSAPGNAGRRALLRLAVRAPPRDNPLHGGNARRREPPPRRQQSCACTRGNLTQRNLEGDVGLPVGQPVDITQLRPRLRHGARMIGIDPLKSKPLGRLSCCFS